MAISKLLVPQYVDGVTKIEAEHLNAIVSTVNQLVEVANGSSSGGGTTPTAPSAPTITINGSTATISAVSGATIKYTIDGSTPSASVGTTYSSAIALTASCTIKAVAIKDGLVSSVANKVYTHQSTEPTPTTYVLPTAFNGVDYANGTGNVIKNEGDYVLYSANYSNKKNIAYLMTQYAISDNLNNPEAWWNVGVTSDNHIYLKVDWNNNCADAITNCVLRLNTRKGFSASSVNLNIPLEKGNHSEIFDLAQLIRDGNGSSYQNVTHVGIQGVYSDTADAAALVDIGVKVYGISGQ